MKITLITFLVLLDQFIKVYARELTEKVVFTDFFRLHFVENEGIAFSMPVPQWLIISLTFLVLGWVGWELYRENKAHIKNNKNLKTIDYRLWTTYAYIFIFAGALGNLIDRILLGKVTDFLSFGNFAIFNLADIWINIGVFCFVVGVLMEVLGRKDT